MRGVEVPPALVERLGERAADALVVMVRSTREDMLTVAGERYERRLTEEISRLRVDVANEIGTLRGEMGLAIGTLRADITRELASARVDQFRWSFAFWIGQVATTAGLLAYMLRS